jgi:hypothetical protein
MLGLQAGYTQDMGLSSLFAASHTWEGITNEQEQNPYINISKFLKISRIPYTYVNMCLVEHGLRQLIRVMAIDHEFDYAGVYDHLGAEDARKVSAVQSRILYAYTEGCRLNDGILFGVNSPTQLMTLTGRNIPLFSQAADLRAVSHALGRTIVSC